MKRPQKQNCEGSQGKMHRANWKNRLALAATERRSLRKGGMEAAGIEPASESGPPKASTCLAHALLSLRRLPWAGFCETSREKIRPRAPQHDAGPIPICV